MPTTTPPNDRRRLMAERQIALAAKDYPKFQALTTQIAALPMKGVPALTPQDKERYANGR